MAQKRIINAIITTNFDNMLERAAESLGLPVFQIFSPGISKPYDFHHSNSFLVPYIKLHGDLSARSHIVLTREEIKKGNYDHDILILFKEILKSHTLIMAGYSGFDDKVVEIIEKNAKKDYIYDCNIRLDKKSPLFLKLGHKIRFVQSTFDSFIENVSKSILNKPSFLRFSPTIIEKLFKWRLEYFKEQFYNDHLSLAFFKKPIPRKKAEIQIIDFLISNSHIVFITGKCGFGKSIIGINTCNWQKNSDRNLFFFIKAKSLDKPELDVYIAESLGGIGSEAASVIFSIENWLVETNHHLIIFLDGLNEYCSSIKECVDLFRNTLRLILQLKPNSPIRLIITIREEVWHKVYQDVDHFFLNKILNREGVDKVYSVINITSYSHEEFNEALSRLSDSNLNVLDKTAILMGYEQLRDPFFFNAICNKIDTMDMRQSLLHVFEYSIEDKLATCGSIVHINLIKSSLSNIALKCFSENKTFTLKNFCCISKADELEQKLIDLGFVTRTDAGKLRFSHDRYHEYFLSKSFGFGDAPDISTFRGLQNFIANYKDEPLMISAAKMYFLLNPDEVNTLEDALYTCFAQDKYDFLISKDTLFLFIKEVLIELSIDNPPLLNYLLEDVLQEERIKELETELIRSLNLIIVHLPRENGMHLFQKIIHNREDLSSLEAEIFLTDYILDYYCSLEKEVNLLLDAPFAGYFNDPCLPVWKKMILCFSFVEKLGPFNQNKSEHEKLIKEISPIIFLYANSYSENDCKSFADYILKFCNRLFFNASSLEIQAFFNSDIKNKKYFISLFEHLENGNILNENHYEWFKKYITKIGNNCEFHLCKLAFILSSKNDLEKTIDFWKKIFESFNKDTSPEEVDFMLATLLYLIVVNEVLYTHDFNTYFERVLEHWSRILEYAPGLIRSQWRNMNDDFDKIFEDGFNPIASYIYLQPAARRQSLNYCRYQKSCHPIDGSLYFSYLKIFLENGEISKALRIIHALSSHIMLWPEEGFSYLPLIAKSNDPLIRRAYIRVLAECYHRYPLQTLQYLRTHGCELSDDEIGKLKIRIDPQIGYRQIEDLEWANIAHFFLTVLSDHRNQFYSILKKIIEAQSIHDAIRHVFSLRPFH